MVLLDELVFELLMLAALMKRFASERMKEVEVLLVRLAALMVRSAEDLISFELVMLPLALMVRLLAAMTLSELVKFLRLKVAAPPILISLDAFTSIFTCYWPFHAPH